MFMALASYRVYALVLFVAKIVVIFRYLTPPSSSSTIITHSKYPDLALSRDLSPYFFVQFTLNSRQLLPHKSRVEESMGLASRPRPPPLLLSQISVLYRSVGFGYESLSLVNSRSGSDTVPLVSSYYPSGPPTPPGGPGSGPLHPRPNVPSPPQSP
jgi:hypothetical protein